MVECMSNSAESSANFNVHLKCIVLSEEASIKRLDDSVYLTLRKKKLPWWLGGKESACNAGDEGDEDLIPTLGSSPGGGHGTTLQYSCLENPMDRRAWRAIVSGIAKSWK